MKKRAAAVSQGWNLGARKVDLSIARHEKLYGFDVGIVGGKVSPAMNMLVSQILDGVSQHLEGAPCLLRNIAAPRAGSKCGDRRRSSHHSRTD